MILIIRSIISERAQSLFMSIEISDTYIYIYICGRTSNHMRMLNNSLLGTDIIAMKRYEVKTKVSIRLSIAIQYL